MDVITKLEQMILGLQDLVKFLKRNPKFAERLYVSPKLLSIGFYSKEDKQEFKSFARILATGAGKLEKDYSNYFCKVTRNFGPMVNFQVEIVREAVCERIVTGTKFIEAVSIPAHDEEIVEWRCRG